MIECLFVGAGGFAGAVFRYLMGLIPVFNKSPFPFMTLSINVIGAFIIGAVTQLSESYGVFSENELLLLRAGLCGGFTTFSTFALESAGMMEEGKIVYTAIYAAASVLLCIIAVFAGKYIAGRIMM